MAKNANEDMPTAVKQDANVIPRRRPFTAAEITGGAAVSLALPKDSQFVEITVPIGGDLTFLDWDETATTSQFDAIILPGQTRHFPIPWKNRPETCSVISVSNFYGIVL